MKFEDILKSTKKHLDAASKNENLQWAIYGIKEVAPQLLGLVALGIAIGSGPLLITALIAVILAGILSVWTKMKLLAAAKVSICDTDQDMSGFIKRLLIAAGIAGACLITLIFAPAFGALASFLVIAGVLATAVVDLAQNGITLWKLMQIPHGPLSAEDAARVNAVMTS